MIYIYTVINIPRASKYLLTSYLDTLHLARCRDGAPEPRQQTETRSKKSALELYTIALY